MILATLSVFNYIDALTVEQADASQDAEKALDFKQSTQWDVHSNNSVSFWVELTETRLGEYVAIVGHNLGTEGISLAVESKDLIGDAWETRLASTLITDDNAKYFAFDQIKITKFWRVTLTGNNINTYITQLQIGQALAIGAAQAPITPPILEKSELQYGATQNHFLGKKQRQTPADYVIAIKNLPLAAADLYITTLIQQLTTVPFFYIWDEINYPNEVIYCWPEKPVKGPTYKNIKHFDFTLPVKGVI
jgi:hypothetical protein